MLMEQKTTESALIAALVSAPSADRGLDALIALELEPERFKELKLDAESDLRVLASVFGVARYTASLDAALTLVPTNAQWTLETDTAWVRWVGKNDVEEAQGGFNCREGTCTALALCIAALKAREAINDHKL